MIIFVKFRLFFYYLEYVSVIYLCCIYVNLYLCFIYVNLYLLEQMIIINPLLYLIIILEII